MKSKTIALRSQECEAIANVFLPEFLEVSEKTDNQKKGNVSSWSAKPLQTLFAQDHLIEIPKYLDDSRDWVQLTALFLMKIIINNNNNFLADPTKLALLY